jgi:hypothetical protein
MRQNSAAIQKVRGIIAESRGSGAQGRDRTTDTMIFSHVLYQLSYLGVAAAAAIQTGERLERRPMTLPNGAVQPFQASSSAGGSAGGPGTA